MAVIILIAVTIAANLLSFTFSVLTIRRLRRARADFDMPSPVISFPGTLTPEAEAKLRDQLREGIERLHRKGREPW